VTKIAGTINLPANSTLLTWVGWLLPYDQLIGKIVDETVLAAMLRDLRLIRLDMVPISGLLMLCPRGPRKDIR
jgi:hypothetical protein